jgi:hypothetical protein
MHPKDIFMRREYFPIDGEGHPLLVPIDEHGSADEAHAHGLHELASEALDRHHPSLGDAHRHRLHGEMWMGRLHQVGGNVYEPRPPRERVVGNRPHVEVGIRAHLPGEPTWKAPEKKPSGA